MPCTKWPLAKVERGYPGNDGLVRTATVRAFNSFYNRPVQRLHKLEIESAASQVSPEAEDPVHVESMVGRSRKRTLFILQVYLFPSLN